MNESRPRYTLTLARLYADQGYYEKAEQVYQQLMVDDPENDTIAHYYAEFKDRRRQLDQAGSPDLVALFEKWADLVAKARAVRKSD